MRICYFITDRHGPGNLRSLIPGAELERQYGWEVRSMQTLAVVRNHLNVEADIYVMQRQAHPALPVIVRDMVKLQGHTVIGEVDDWFLGLSSMQDIGKAASTKYYRVMPKILANCTGVTVSTPTLAEGYAAKTRAPIQVIENTLDWNTWESVVTPPSDRFRVGWMGGTAWHLKDIDVLRGVLGPWLRRHPDVQFVAAGDAETHRLLDVPTEQRVTYPTVPHDQLPSITATMDVGLVPLAQSKFNDAKSYLKGLEYAACGIPCIASPVAEYKRWVKPGVNGFLAERPRDWLRFLDRMYADRELVARMGAAARAMAAQHVIQTKVHAWRDFYVQCYKAQQRANEGRRLESEFTTINLEMLDHGYFDNVEPEAVQ